MMVERMQDRTVDESQIHESNTVVHILRKIWRPKRSRTRSYGSRQASNQVGWQA